MRALYRRPPPAPSPPRPSSPAPSLPTTPGEEGEQQEEILMSKGRGCPSPGEVGREGAGEGSGVRGEGLLAPLHPADVRRRREARLAGKLLVAGDLEAGEVPLL